MSVLIPDLNYARHGLIMSNNTDEIPLENLKRGARATVTTLIGENDEVARLSAMGLQQGVELCTIRKGCPCIVEFGCSRMCIRTSGQLKVMVKPV